ncbi:MAG: outer membrane protein OmpK [Pseudomonas helleri]|nr:outer membrane protein OmpK [Pseudomonas syringae]
MNNMIRARKAAMAMACTALASSYQAQAGDFVNFQMFDASLYAQAGNEIDPEKTISPIFEAFGDYSIGDMYVYSIWQNAMEPNQQGTSSTYYYKFVPRLSFGKILGKDLSFGPLKDISFAQWISRTKGYHHEYMPGLGLDWDVPGFSWLRTMYYFEHNEQQGWNDRRIHIDYGYPFSTRYGDFRVVGTFDHTFGGRGQAKVTDFKPELHYDLGKAFGQAPGHLWTGIVLNPIKNKYKIEDSDDFPTNQVSYGALIRYSFF